MINLEMETPQTIHDLENSSGSVIRFQVETLNSKQQIYMYCPQNQHPTLCPIPVNEAREHWDRLIAEGWRVKETRNV
jgi:hypothetical protein